MTHRILCPDTYLALEAARLAQTTDQVVLVARDVAQMDKFDEVLRLARATVLPFPQWEILPFDRFSPHSEITARRLRTLRALTQGGRGVVLMTAAGVAQKLIGRKTLTAASQVLALGDEWSNAQAEATLARAGYRRVDLVEGPGEFAVRGDLIELFSPWGDQPVRIDRFGDEIESIRCFDPSDQRTTERLESLTLLPVREVILRAGDDALRGRLTGTFGARIVPTALFSDLKGGIYRQGIEFLLPLIDPDCSWIEQYLSRDALWVVARGVEEQGQTFWHEALDRHAEAERHGDFVVEPRSLYRSGSDLPAVWGKSALVQVAQPPADTAIPGVALPARVAVEAQRWRELAQWAEQQSGRLVVVADGTGQNRVVREIFATHKLTPAADLNEALGRQGHFVVPGVIPDSVTLPDGTILLSSRDLFGARVHRRAPVSQSRERERIASAIRRLDDLKEGDWVVHADHGIARYQGLVRLDAGGMPGDYLLLMFDQEGRLYVPVDQLTLVSKYQKGGEGEVKADRLGSDRWVRTRRKAREKILELAGELIEVQAKRNAARRPVYEEGGITYEEFASAFPFEETDDQLTAIQAIESDLEAPRPMDRLICGDVGFGKTEVAMRAAMRAVLAGRQVVLLAPTTILVNQHLNTFERRFAGFPVRIEAMSRFNTRKEQQEILAAAKEGKVDVLLGTHRLLQKDVELPRMGMLIVDEEQRFGVAHKERLKKMRDEVDILTLTATPIPRTLNMALAGLRDLSLITTPPTDRLAVRTFVSQWDDRIIQEAVRRELHRGGQVYFVHNRVESIEATARSLGKLVPEATIRVAHGQMSEGELEEVMLDLYEGRVHILVASTIIESGLDVPSANTIIINRADKLGLGQLYQLRGRVGRSKHRAYCYLIAPKIDLLSEDAQQRLRAVSEMDRLGGGFALATQDMEIRGAGNLLGEEQSGEIDAVGLSLFMELLEDATAELKGEKRHAPAANVEAVLGIPTLIPEEYVPDMRLRLTLYRRINEVATQDQADGLLDELRDRFGTPPEPVVSLVNLMPIKAMAAKCGIKRIEAGPKGMSLRFGETPLIPAAKLVALIQKDPKRFLPDGPLGLVVRVAMPEAADRLERAKQVMRRLERMVG